MESKNVTIIGAGGGALPIAAYTSSLGHKVTLWNRTPENVIEVVEAGRKFKKKGLIDLLFSNAHTDEIWRQALNVNLNKILSNREEANNRLKTITGVKDLMILPVFLHAVYAGESDIEKVVKDADIIRVIIPSTGHKYIAEIIAPHLGKKGKEQIILLEPGRTFGAVEVYNILKEKGIDLNLVTVAEAGTFVYASRILDANLARIMGVKKHVPVAAIPAERTNKVASYIRGILHPQFNESGDGTVLYTSFDNMGAIFHAKLMPLLAGLVDVVNMYNKDPLPLDLKIEYYRQAVNESVGRILEKADEERVAVAKAYGVKVPTARKWLERSYGIYGATLDEALSNCHEYVGIMLPESVNVRYVFEDCRTSALPIALLGEKAGVQCPSLYAAVIDGGALLNQDFTKDGRTLESMGIKDLSVEQIKNLAKYGEP